jgi:hypothetical protein
MEEIKRNLILTNGDKIEINSFGKYTDKFIENNLLNKQFRIVKENESLYYLRCRNDKNDPKCLSKITLKKVGNENRIFYLKAHEKYCKQKYEKEELTKDYYNGAIYSEKYGEYEINDTKNFVLFEFSSGLLEIFLLKRGENIVSLI